MSDDLERVERAFARQMGGPTSATDTGGLILRRDGTVTAVNGDGTVDVEVGGETIPGARCKAWYGPAVDDKVFVECVDTDWTVDGPVDWSPRRPAHQLLRVPPAGTGHTTGTPLTTNQTIAQLQGDFLFVSGRRYRIGFLVWAAGGTVSEWYFRIVANGTNVQQVRYSPASGINSPSPQGSGFWTADATGSLDVHLDVQLSAGSGTIFLASTNAEDTSWLVVEDVT